ncbi:hypothetical protein J6590_024990 [Homalodisca vitripennis]|nr:hypothetical protein J6590_024990 [Homalodisca vitripennis]
MLSLAADGAAKRLKIPSFRTISGPRYPARWIRRELIHLDRPVHSTRVKCFTLHPAVVQSSSTYLKSDAIADLTLEIWSHFCLKGSTKIVGDEERTPCFVSISETPRLQKIVQSTYTIECTTMLTDTIPKHGAATEFSTHNVAVVGKLHSMSLAPDHKIQVCDSIRV